MSTPTSIRTPGSPTITPPPLYLSPRTPSSQNLPISRHHLYRKCTPEFCSPTHIKRKVTPYTDNLSPSVEAPVTTATENVVQRGMIAEHAYMRMQLFYITALQMSHQAVRSDGSIRQDIQVKIQSARDQHGQATTFGNHAAHDNGGAGVSERIKKILIKEIINEKKITPKKMQTLFSRGFCQETLNSLVRLTSDESAFLEFFYQVWPSRGRQPESIIDDTHAGVVASGTTTEVPRVVNLVCDKRLENCIRDYMCELYVKVLEGNMTPEDATIEYHRAVQLHFQTAIPNIQQRITDLKTYAKNLTILNKIENNRLNRCTNQRTAKWEKIINQSIVIKKRLQARNHEGSPAVRFSRIGRLFPKNKSMDIKSVILSAKINIKEKYDQIIEQVQKQKEKLEQVLEYTTYECQGTQIPQFELLKGPPKEVRDVEGPATGNKKRSAGSESEADNQTIAATPPSESAQVSAPAATTSTYNYPVPKATKLSFSDTNENISASTLNTLASSKIDGLT